MEQVEHEKCTTRNKYSVKRVHIKTVQHEKRCDMKRVQHKKMQHEKGARVKYAKKSAQK